MIPGQLIDFNAYESGNTLIGVADVALPEIALMSETVSGAGIAGEIDLTTIGQTQSMVTTINWRSLLDTNISFAAPKTYHLEFWGSQEVYNEISGDLETQQIKFVIRGIPKKLATGNFEKNSMMGTSAELETIYLKLSTDGKERLEIDKINSVYKVDGVDYLAKVRQDIGKA